MENKEILRNLSLMLITDRSLCKFPFMTTIKMALEGGVGTVQLREKNISARELYYLAEELKKLTSEYHANLIINDRVDIAIAAEADGVHLGWKSLPIAIARKAIGFEKKVIGVSIHNRQEALEAQEQGADYITFGPVFATPSKAGILSPTGPEAIKELKTDISIPVIALGGINEKNAGKVLEEKADGVAVISNIMKADSPEFAAKILYKKVIKALG